MRERLSVRPGAAEHAVEVRASNINRPVHGWRDRVLRNAAGCKRAISPANRNAKSSASRRVESELALLRVDKRAIRLPAYVESIRTTISRSPQYQLEANVRS